jgi:hypothetical protein
MDTGGLLETSGLIFAHEGERVLPTSQVSDRGEASLDSSVITDAMVKAGEMYNTQIRRQMSSLTGGLSTPDMGGGGVIEVNINGDDSEVLGGADEDTLAQAIARELSGELSTLSGSMDDVRREVKRLRRGQSVSIKADGKVIAEVSEKNKDRYKRSRNITR